MLDSLDPLLQHKTFPPILLLFGDEEYLLDESLRTLTQALLPLTADTLNFDVFDGATTSLNTVLDTANSFPMMADKRAIIVHNAEKNFTKSSTKSIGKSSGKPSKKQPTDSLHSPPTQTPLQRYIAEPNPNTVLILVAHLPDIAGIFDMLRNSKQQTKAQQKIAKLSEPFISLIQHGKWYECASVREREIPAWIAKRTATAGKTITPEAAELLALQTGTSLRDLANEINKTITFIGTAETITVEDILSLVGSTKQYSVFALQKMIALRQRHEAFTILQRLVVIERQELVILTLLTKYFLVLWKIIEARRTAHTPGAIASAVGANVYFIDEYLTAATTYSLRDVEHALLALHDADIALKSSGDDPYLVMQRLLLNIMGETQKVRSPKLP
jgi:DNA polymerase III subunit delta